MSLQQLKISKSILQGQLKPNTGTELSQTLVRVLSSVTSSTVYLVAVKQELGFSSNSYIFLACCYSELTGATN